MINVKVYLFVLFIILGEFNLVADPTITIHKVTPISPWAVQIDYDVVGGRAVDGLWLSVSNTVTHQVYFAREGTVRGDFNMAEGRHSIRWDTMNEKIKCDVCNVVFTIGSQYLIVDISGGKSAAKYPISYLNKMPTGGWTDEYKKTKLVLRCIPSGSFKMGEYSVTLTQPFYMGVFEVTQKQYELVTGNKLKDRLGDTRPVEFVSWNTFRGDYNWPIIKTVNPNSFIGLLRMKTGLSFDLPTEAQWEYACRAGTTSSYNNGGDTEADLKTLGRYGGNKNDGRGGYTEHTTVGSYAPNAWGLYDMHGNVREWCLDWHGELSDSIDPLGVETGTSRVVRGGSWFDGAHYCPSSVRDRDHQSMKSVTTGFRLACFAGE